MFNAIITINDLGPVESVRIKGRADATRSELYDAAEATVGQLGLRLGSYEITIAQE